MQAYVDACRSSKLRFPFGFAPENFVVPVRAKFRIDVDEIDIFLRQLSQLVELFTALDYAGIYQSGCLMRNVHLYESKPQSRAPAKMSLRSLLRSLREPRECAASRGRRPNEETSVVRNLSEFGCKLACQRDRTTRHSGSIAARTLAKRKIDTARPNATTRTRRCSNFPDALVKEKHCGR